MGLPGLDTTWSRKSTKYEKKIREISGKKKCVQDTHSEIGNNKTKYLDKYSSTIRNKIYLRKKIREISKEKKSILLKYPITNFIAKNTEN